MVRIKFKNVLNGKPYKTSGYTIPTVAGVYIYGLLLDVLNEDGKIEKKFCPLAVGEASLRKSMKGLRGRLNDEKYELYKTGGAGVKELFDFSNKAYTREKLRAIYDDMRVYDLLLNSVNKLVKLVNKFVSGGLTNFIYFQDFNFFNHILQQPIIKPNDNKPHPVAISTLRKVNSPVSNTFADKIEHTKENYEDLFYFVLAYDEPTEAFATNGEPTEAFATKWNRENIETNAKLALQKMGIYTTEKHRKKNVPAIHIDLSEIEDILIDL